MSLQWYFSHRDLEAGDNQSLKIQVARPGIEPRSSCSASQELNHSAAAAPTKFRQDQLGFYSVREVYRHKYTSILIDDIQSTIKSFIVSF